MDVKYPITAGFFWFTALFTLGQAAYIQPQAELLHAALSRFRQPGIDYSVRVRQAQDDVRAIQGQYPELASGMSDLVVIIQSSNPSPTPALRSTGPIRASTPAPAIPRAEATYFPRELTQNAPVESSEKVENGLEAIANRTMTDFLLYSVLAVVSAAAAGYTTLRTWRSFRMQPKMNTSSAVP
ncbi:hypothetical protein HYY74_01940 [Candidatus Woesearchaeota archaeon]|nr:hypothetical protein [Candidatus Woesearchaeota archaeon]